MKIEYKLTDYFDKNNLFDNDSFNGITIKNDSNALLIKGEQRDLVELADLLLNVASSKEKSAHIHFDSLTLLNKKSDFSEVIIEREQKN